MRETTIILLFLLAFTFAAVVPAFACSSFELKRGDRVVYAHNLNQGDMGIPGQLFINKRGMFKHGCTWNQLTFPDPTFVSEHTWISRYGSVTLSFFGRDFPDGGVNEEGLFIWEMGEDAEYPNDPAKPALSQNNWMQYVLDTCMTVEEAIACAGAVSIDGWGWHYFVGDASGAAAAIAFIDGKPLVHTGSEMPYPALFNSPYAWELEFMRMFEGFGGHYPVDVTDPRVPRFVRYARLTEQMTPGDDIVDYGLEMLNTLKVHDDPEWSSLYDESQRVFYFRTRLTPTLKQLDLDDVDFSNATPTLTGDIDKMREGDALPQLTPVTNAIVREFFTEKVIPVLPDGFFDSDGRATDDVLDDMASHTDAGIAAATKILAGEWSNTATRGENEMAVQFFLTASDAAVSGEVVLYENGERLPLDHFSMIANALEFTFFTPRGNYVLAKCKVDGDTMQVALHGPESFFGTYELTR